MPTTSSTSIRNLFRGVNQSFGRHQLAEGELWNVLNFRPERGKMRITPPLINWFTLTNLTDESSQTQIKLLKLVRNLNNNLRYVILNHKTARYVDPTSTSTQVQIPVVLQVNKPNKSDITGECLLYGFNLTDFAATGDSIEVEIDSATTFKWRRNTDSWTTGVAIGPEVNLGSNGLKVSFQDDEDYTSGDNWKWERSWNHPYTGADASTFNFPFSTAVYNKDLYIGGVERNVLRLRDDFLTSVGYSRVYGKYVSVFQNKLFVSHYAPGVYDGVLGIKDSYNAARTPFVVAWSHLDNPDQFFSTDINEADEYEFPQQDAHDWSNLGITGQGELNDRFFVYLPTSIKVGTYVGLPTVMQWNTAHPSIGNLFPSGLVKSARGHYFISQDDIYFYNGIELKAIGSKVIDKFKEEVAPITDSRYSMTRGDYDADRGEVIFTYWMQINTGVYQARQMIYQEKTDDWYFRNLPSASSDGTDIYCQTKFTGVKNRQVYGGLGIVYQDWISGNGGTYVKDDIVTGTAKYTTPFVETMLRDYGFRHAMKETTEMLVDYYTNSPTTLGILVQISVGNRLAAMEAYADLGVYEPEGTIAVGRWLTFTKKHGRVLGFKFSIYNGNTVVRDGILYGYEEFIKGHNQSTEK